MFTEDDIMTYSNFNTIENRIEEFTNEIKEINLNNYQYTEFSTSSTYNVGDLVLYNGNIYRCKTAVTTPGEWTGTEDTGNIVSVTYSHPQQSINEEVFISHAMEYGSGTYVGTMDIENSVFTMQKDGVLIETLPIRNYDNIWGLDFHIVDTSTITVVFEATYANWEEIQINIIPTYTKKTWSRKDFLLYTYLNNIEEGIYNLGKYYFKPYGWSDKKTWTSMMNFSYKDVNRWIANLDLIEERLNNESNTLFPSDTLYPSDNLLPH